MWDTSLRFFGWQIQGVSLSEPGSERFTTLADLPFRIHFIIVDSIDSRVKFIFLSSSYLYNQKDCLDTLGLALYNRRRARQNFRICTVAQVRAPDIPVG